MLKLLLPILALTFLAACSNEVHDLKSPCVGAEDSPCDRRAVNQGLV